MSKRGKKRRGQGHVPVYFWSLNANSFKVAKDANFKFSTHDPRQSQDMTPKKFAKRARGQGHVTPSFLDVKCQQLHNG